jgi:hypothetical protein
MTTTLTRVALAATIALCLAGASICSTSAEASVRATKALKIAGKASTVMLNPQPLPPGQGPCRPCLTPKFNQRLNYIR